LFAGISASTPICYQSAINGSWPTIIADLDALTDTEVEQDGRRFLRRSAPRPATGLALRAAGVALPPTVQAIAER